MSLYTIEYISLQGGSKVDFSLVNKFVHNDLYDLTTDYSLHKWRHLHIQPHLKHVDQSRICRRYRHLQRLFEAETNKQTSKKTTVSVRIHPLWFIQSPLVMNTSCWSTILQPVAQVKEHKHRTLGPSVCLSVQCEPVAPCKV